MYRKATHTDLYTHYTSHHHPSVKTGTINCLKNRAERICDEENKEEELSHLKDVFRNNGYPVQLIVCTLARKCARSDDVNVDEPEEERPKTMHLPYIKGLSEAIQRVCNKVGVRAVFKSRNTPRDLLLNVKTKPPELKRKEVIYQIPCRD